MKVSGRVLISSGVYLVMVPADPPGRVLISWRHPSGVDLVRWPPSAPDLPRADLGGVILAKSPVLTSVFTGLNAFNGIFI